MTENMKVFLEKVSEDKALTAKVMQLDINELIALAKELNCELCASDFAKDESQLNKDELETVIGGGDCLCVAAGGGTRDEDSKPCGCVAAGAGYHDNGEQRCFCLMGGSGDTKYAIPGF